MGGFSIVMLVLRGCKFRDTMSVGFSGAPNNGPLGPMVLLMGEILHQLRLGWLKSHFLTGGK